MMTITRRFLPALLVALLPSCALAGPSRERTLGNVRVSFYCGKCSRDHHTRSGRSFALPGVAVDPRVIPLGSRVHVPGFGWFVADDTGRLIQGSRIDLRLASRGQCSRLGVQRKTIKFTKPKKRKAH